MDKKSIVNDLYQAVVISVFVISYMMLGKKDTKDHSFFCFQTLLLRICNLCTCVFV